jgi:hypothetical protein
MAHTRKKLGEDVASLNHWLFGTQTTNKGAKQPMATKKASSKSSPARAKTKKSVGKKTSPKKSASARARPKAMTGKKSTRKRSGRTVTGKAKQVLGDVLAGAAAGAVAGAAQAALADVKQEPKEGGNVTSDTRTAASLE